MSSGKGKQQAILHARRYKIHTEPEKYYHAKLLLYYPWNEEDGIISTYPSYHDSYITKHDIIHQNAQKFNEDCVAFDIDLQNLENNIPQSAWEMVAPNIAQDDRTHVQGFYTLPNQQQGKEDTTETVSHGNHHKYNRYMMYVVCKSSKKAGYEFSQLLHTYTQLEHRTMPYSNVQ